MKKNILPLIAIAAVFAGCKSSKQSQQAFNQPPYGYQQPYPNYNGYQPQGGYYPQPGQYQQVNPNQPTNGYQQQYQSQQGPDAAGFVEIQKSPIEELALAVGTNEIRAYGSAESGNAQMAFNAARAQATAALKEKMEVYVRAGLDQYVQETGVNSEYSLDEATRNQVITAVKGIINGASVLDSRKLFNPKNKRYKYEVCMKYDRAGILNAMQQQSERIRNNEKQFEADMKEAWDALDAENNRVSLTEQQQMRQNAMQQNNLDRANERKIERIKQYNTNQNQETQNY